MIWNTCEQTSTSSSGSITADNIYIRRSAIDPPMNLNNKRSTAHQNLSPVNHTIVLHAGELLPTLEIMSAVVAFVLLIACANVGNLLLVRFFLRRHEMMVRLALGTPRLRLVRQLLTESLILSVFAAGGGLLVARWCRNALVLFYPRDMLVAYLPGEIDWRVLALSIGVCVLATVLFGLVPAAQAGRLDLAAALKSEMGGVVSGQSRSRSRSRLRSGLVLVQVCLSFLLLVGAGLLLRGLRVLQNSNPGFSTHNVLFRYVDLFGSGYDTQRAEDFQKQLIARLQPLATLVLSRSSRDNRKIPLILSVTSV
jgi:hypothetical protein